MEFAKGPPSKPCSTPSCDGKSCVRETDCQGACGAFNYCHLCPDRECTACANYITCDASSCGDNATNNGNVCKCKATYGRPDSDYICQLCLAPC
jgi:hypothetical protein